MNGKNYNPVTTLGFSELLPNLPANTATAHNTYQPPAAKFTPKVWEKSHEYFLFAYSITIFSCFVQTLFTAFWSETIKQITYATNTYVNSLCVFRVARFVHLPRLPLPR